MLPVSSSGHLALGRHFFDLEADAGWVEVFLHTGTLLSIILYYRKRIWTLIDGYRLTSAGPDAVFDTDDDIQH